MKTSELSGAALDWAVAKCLAVDGFGAREVQLGEYGPLFGKGYLWPSLGSTKVTASTNWSQGGPIIERNGINLLQNTFHSTYWEASIGSLDDHERPAEIGPTPLIAAMRCFVSSKLGDDVEIPEELK